ncbi:hypothetical protein [Variovorax paradoxus]|uniref:hypothetical protein n=1 Tax=Variovorax paradoxus TaxID=34073 RepID=UPI001ABCCCA6
MHSAAIEHAPGVLFTREVRYDSYTGTPRDLLAAGLVREDQLPGQPGNGISMVSFHADGRRVGKGHAQACREIGYLKVRKMGKRLLCVERGVGEAEYRRRSDAWMEQRDREYEEREALARCWPFPVVCGVPV